MVKNEANFNGQICSPAEEEYDLIPVREYKGYQRRNRNDLAEEESRTSGDKCDDALILDKEYEVCRWYGSKDVRYLTQNISFHNDNENDDDYNPCSPEGDFMGKRQRGYYDEEIDIDSEVVSEKLDGSRMMHGWNDVNTNREEFGEPCLFSFEYFKQKWRKFRALIDYCYPALTRKKEYYKCPFPCCPSRDPRNKLMLEDEEGQPADPSGESASSANLVEPPKDQKVKPEKFEESLDDRPIFAGRGLDVFDPSGLDDPIEDDSKQQIAVRPCCEDEDFWGTLFQILILAPLLAFTAYLFIQWFETRQEYKRTLRKLYKVKKENENLIFSIDCFNAFVMSCQTSPIVCLKGQCELWCQVMRLRESLKNHKEKIKELEQDRAVSTKVLQSSKTCA